MSAFNDYLAAETASGFAVHGDVESEVMSSSSGLVGRHWRMSGTRLPRDDTFFRVVIIFRSPPYVYWIRMETANADRLPEHRQLLLDTARSAMRIPEAGAGRIGRGAPVSSAELFSHWID